MFKKLTKKSMVYIQWCSVIVAVSLVIFTFSFSLVMFKNFNNVYISIAIVIANIINGLVAMIFMWLHFYSKKENKRMENYKEL